MVCGGGWDWGGVLGRGGGDDGEMEGEEREEDECDVYELCDESGGRHIGESEDVEIGKSN